MKTLLKTFFSLLLLSFAFSNLRAQTTGKKKNVTPAAKTKTTTTVKKAAPRVIGKEVILTLKNRSEGTVALFAGPKDELQNKTYRKTVGGSSKNTIYLHVNEVVCILNGDKILSCAAIQAGTTLLEINSSGNVITAN